MTVAAMDEGEQVAHQLFENDLNSSRNARNK